MAISFQCQNKQTKKYTFFRKLLSLTKLLNPKKIYIFVYYIKIFMSFGKKCTITQYHYKILHHRWHYLIFFDGLFSQDVSYKSSHSLTANNTKCKERPSKINNCHCIYTWRSHFWQQRTPLTDSVHWYHFSSAAISQWTHIKHEHVSFVFQNLQIETLKSMLTLERLVNTPHALCSFQGFHSRGSSSPDISV